MTIEQVSKSVLQAARDIISDPAHWSQGKASCDANGEHINIFSEDAVSFCLLGAVERALDSATHYIYYSNLFVGPHGNGVDFNDSHTHQEVLDFLDNIIAKLP